MNALEDVGLHQRIHFVEERRAEKLSALARDFDRFFDAKDDRGHFGSPGKLAMTIARWR